MKILIATDFSKCADDAARYGFEIASRAGAVVTLLHVVYPYQHVDNNIYEAFWIDDYLKQRKSALDKLADRLRHPAGFSEIKVKLKVETGFPVPQICQMADEIGADLVVIGSTGASNLADLFLGSKAAGVVGKSRVPVLIVPAKTKFHAPAATVFATDFDLKISGHSLATFKKLMEIHLADVKVLHVLDQSGELPDKGGEGTVARKLASIPHHFHYLHDSDVPQAVVNFVESTEAQLLVCISHDHKLLHQIFYQSVSKVLAEQVRVPMLVLHDELVVS